MTRVCLVGTEGSQLAYELLSRETSREALASYELHEPYHNSVAVETVSLGAAVSLLNDLEWYLIRFVGEAMVLEPSISDEEWLSRDLATAVRDSEVDPADTGRLLKVYGLEPTDGSDGSSDTGEERTGGTDRIDGRSDSGEKHAGGTDRIDGQEGETVSMEVPESGPADGSGSPRLVEPMFVARTGDRLPSYDLRDVHETLLLRVTEREFEA